MNDGWIKLHRKVLDNEVFRHDRTAWHVFETLLLIANKDTGKWSGGSFQLAELTGVNKPTLYKAIQRLEKAKMINREVNTRYTVYNIGSWSEYQANGKHSVNSGETAGNTLTRIRNRNITTNVVIGKPYGKPEINDLFSYWQEQVGYEITARRQANRNACSNLHKKYGEEKLKQLIRGVAQAQSDRYAPRIGDFAELQINLNKLLAWGKTAQQQTAVKSFGDKK